MTEKRKGSMSDADRALLSRRERVSTSPTGVPLDQHPEEDSLPIIVTEDGDTPVETPRGQRRRKRVSTQEFAELAWEEIRTLRKRLDNLATTDANGILEVVQRVAQLEGRLETVLGLGESVEDLRALNMQVAELRVSLFGLDGKNGKIGTLRGDVDKAIDRASAAPRFVKRAIVIAAGSIVGSLVTAILYIRTAVDKAAEARAVAAAEGATIRAELDASKSDRAFLHQQLDSMLRLVRRVPSSTSNQPGDPP